MKRVGWMAMVLLAVLVVCVDGPVYATPTFYGIADRLVARADPAGAGDHHHGEPAQGAEPAEHRHSHDHPGAAGTLAPGTHTHEGVGRHEMLYSNTNHNLAGIFLILLGIVALLEGFLGEKLPFLKFIWPLSFLFLGIFLFIRSDPEVFPLGSIGLIQGMLNDPEVFQHKTISLIMIVLGAIELFRKTGHLAQSGWAYVFPLVAILGGVMLIFHNHKGHHPGMIDMRMHKIVVSHISMAILGIFLGIIKLLQESRALAWKVGAVLWPKVVVVIGLILLFYSEF